MAKSSQFRFQHSAVSTPTETGVVSIYADISGVLKMVRPGGDSYFLGNVLENLLSGNFPGSIPTGASGYANVPATPFLGATTKFGVFVGASGESWAVPLYRIS